MAVFTEVARDVAFLRCAMVNVVAIANASRWILVDAPVFGHALEMPYLTGRSHTRLRRRRHYDEAGIDAGGHDATLRAARPAGVLHSGLGSRDSVRRLSALAPALLVPGHGQPWGGDEMRRRLSALAEHFDDMERPRFGRYTRQPAVADETGIVMLPRDPLPAYLAGVGAMAAAAALVWAASRTPNRTPNLQPKNPNRRT